MKLLYPPPPLSSYLSKWRTGGLLLISLLTLFGLVFNCGDGDDDSTETPTPTTTSTSGRDYGAGLFNRKFTVATEPYGIAITSNGVLLVTSINTHAVHFYDPASGEPTNMDLELTPDDAEDALTSTNRFGSMGNATNQFNLPYDIAVGDDGKIYVADQNNARGQIFEEDFAYDTSTIRIRNPFPVLVHGDTLHVRGLTYAVADLVAGMDLGTSVRGLDIDGDDVYHIANLSDDRVEAFTGDRTAGFTARSHTYSLRPSGSESDETSSSPYDVVVGPTTGRIYVSDAGRNQVVVLGYDGHADSNHYTLVGVLGNADYTSGSGDGEFDDLKRMLIHNGQLYIIDYGNNRVQVFDVPE